MLQHSKNQSSPTLELNCISLSLHVHLSLTILSQKRALAASEVALYRCQRSEGPTGEQPRVSAKSGMFCAASESFLTSCSLSLMHFTQLFCADIVFPHGFFFKSTFKALIKMKVTSEKESMKNTED